jgi:hypothetical protein
MKIVLIAMLYFFSSGAFAGTTAEYIQANAIPMAGFEIPADALSQFSRSKLLLVGDFHGTNEIPQVVFSIAKGLSRTKKIKLGFEFPIDIQNQVAAFMLSGDETLLRQTRFFSDSNYHSGKGSLQMIQLLKNLRTLKNVEIFCFDLPESDSSTSEERETKLALNLLSTIRQSSGEQIVVYTGNIHSRLTPGVPWDANYPTMGSEIIRLSHPDDNLDSITSLLARPGEGSAFFCPIIDSQVACGAYPIAKSTSDYFSAIPSDYVLKESALTDGHSHSLVLHRVSASMPFK